MELKAMQWDEEFTPFLEWVLLKAPVNVLEIGTGLGGTLQRIGRRSTGMLVSIDLPTDLRGRANSVDITGLSLHQCARRNAVLSQEFPGRFYGLLEDSHLIPNINHFAVLGPFDLIFLDGDDTYDGKRQDFEMFSPLLRAGGHVAIHDINAKNTGVPKFWEKLEGHKFEFNCHKHWGGIGVWHP